ncbi:hypothetical protein [Rhodococcus sp. SGAir0479]|uniref:hypothetical protein n=1 Tax=Rhodococcus sp. SGAir0479 TaxID=2567884 RepID=UPI0010CCD8EA|nr:hypothetical protein [Rhodococcus sp. SGAir0479]QCQ90326.1 hypothetical protein E7742_03235 [Rhodococcus sp. SGAir0479]
MTYEAFGTARRRRADGWAVRMLRALSGLATGGVLVLTVVVAVVGYLASSRDFPGPGGESIAAHVAASIIVTGLQVVADRRRGAGAALAALAVFVVSGALLWTQWWN